MTKYLIHGKTSGDFAAAMLNKPQNLVLRLVQHGSGKVSARLAVDQILGHCLLYTSPSPRDRTRSRMPSSA